MKKIIAFITLIALIISSSIFTTGCSADESIGKSAVCFVIANTANSQGINVTNPTVQDTIYDVIRGFGYISIVNVDGNPDLVFSQGFDIDDKYKNASSERLDADAHNNSAMVTEFMQGVIADDPEADYLKSLGLAVRSLSSLSGYDSKSIIVLGTGLSTTGVLNFCNNLLATEPEIVVSILEEQEAIPDFTGINVTWAQLGDVAEPQNELPARMRNKLIDIYDGIITAGNGTFTYDSIIAASSNSSTGGTVYPPVSTVDIPEESPVVFEYESEIEEATYLLDTPVVLTEEQVTFIEDSADYLNSDLAIDTLIPIAEWLNDNESVNILLVGTTAGDSNSEFSMNLSTDRANAVRDTLISLGVQPERIITIGMGSSDPWHVYGLGYDDAASVNRKVVIIDAQSDLAQDILSSLYG